MLDRFASPIRKSPPQVFIVGLISHVLCIDLRRDVSAKDDSGKLLGFDSDSLLLRVQTGSKEARIFVGLVGLGRIQLTFGRLALFVIIVEDLT